MDHVDWLIEQARRYPLLTQEQEIQLGRQVQAWIAIRDEPDPTPTQKAIIRRGRRAHDKFMLSNIRLVVKIANFYDRFNCGLAKADLVSEGLIGLQKSICKYDPSLGYKFSTYSTWWIRQAISRGIDSYGSLIYLSANGQQIARRAVRWINDQELQTGRKPTLEHIAEHFKTPVESMRLYLHHRLSVMSLDAPINDGGKRSITLLDAIEDPNGTIDIAEFSELHGELEHALNGLTEPQRDVVVRRYLQPEPDSYSVIAKDYGVSRERMRQHHDRALRIMRCRLARLRHEQNVADALAMRCA